jgi:pimeloyl-ACP methyl ester carboxylesterase
MFRMALNAKTVDAAGRRISYFEAGKGPPLVLLHGIGSSGESFEGQLGSLAGRFRVVAWNAPGYGETDPAQTFEATEYAAAAAALMDALETGPVNLLGHSLGAIIASRFAVMHPDRVRRLVLANPAGGYGGAPPEVRAKRLDERIRGMDELGPAGLAEARSKVLVGPKASDATIEKVKAVHRKLKPEGYKQAGRLLASADIFADAARIAAPTLVMCGDADVVTPEVECRKIAAAIRGARYRSLPDLGHMSYLEDAAMFDGVLVDFLTAQA